MKGFFINDLSLSSLIERSLRSTACLESIGRVYLPFKYASIASLLTQREVTCRFLFTTHHSPVTIDHSPS